MHPTSQAAIHSTLGSSSLSNPPPFLNGRPLVDALREYLDFQLIFLALLEEINSLLIAALCIVESLNILRLETLQDAEEHETLQEK